MTIKDFKKIIKQLKEYYSDEMIDNIIIGYEIIDENGGFAVAKAVTTETTVEDVIFGNDNQPTLTLVLSEFEEEQDTREQVLGYPINLN